MNKLVDTRAQFGCLTIVIIGAFVVTYMTTSSLNPFDVYSSDSIFAKIIVSFAIFQILLSIFMFIQIYSLRCYVRTFSGKPADDVICMGCGLPLIAYMGSHGRPIACPKCGTLWHNGPACYSKGLSKVVNITISIPCPKCRQAEARTETFLYDLDDWDK